MTPTALGIQSIIIGPNYKEEEMKTPIDEEFVDDHKMEVEYQSEYPKTAKLEPIHHSTKPKSGISERMKEVIRSQASIKSGNYLTFINLGDEVHQAEKQSFDDNDMDDIWKINKSNKSVLMGDANHQDVISSKDSPLKGSFNAN